MKMAFYGQCERQLLSLVTVLGSLHYSCCLREFEVFQQQPRLFMSSSLMTDSLFTLMHGALELSTGLLHIDKDSDLNVFTQKKSI